MPRIRTRLAAIAALFSLLNGANAQNRPCYRADGVLKESSFAAQACFPSETHSMCCDTVNYQETCMQNGLCHTAGGDYVRETCTDSTWNSPFCLKNTCGGAGHYDQYMTLCGDGSYCCGQSNSTCCLEGNGFILQNIFEANDINTLMTLDGTTPTATTSKTTASTTSRSTSTTSTTADADTSSTTTASRTSGTMAGQSTSSSTESSVPESSGLSSSAKVGLGVGLGLGAAIVALAAALFFVIRKRKQKNNDAAVNHPHAPPMGGEYKPQGPVYYANGGYQQPEYHYPAPPAEMQGNTGYAQPPHQYGTPPPQQYGQQWVQEAPVYDQPTPHPHVPAQELPGR